MVSVPQRISNGNGPVAEGLDPQYLLMASSTAYMDSTYRPPPSEDPESTIPAGRNTAVPKQNPRVQPLSPGGPADIIQERFPEPRNIQDLERDRSPSPKSFPVQPGRRERLGDPTKVISQAEGVQVAGGPDDIWKSIFQQESSSGRDLRTSSTGAKGPAQIMPGTWKEWARPGENINNYDDNVAVGKRMIKSYHDRYGGDPARVAVAYFSGPGNVAPAGSPTPWKQDRSDGATRTSTYVRQVVGRLGLPSAEGGTEVAGADIGRASLGGGQTATRGHSAGSALSTIIGDEGEFIARHGEDSLKRVAEMQRELEAFHERLRRRRAEA